MTDDPNSPSPLRGERLKEYLAVRAEITRNGSSLARQMLRQHDEVVALLEKLQESWAHNPTRRPKKKK